MDRVFRVVQVASYGTRPEIIIAAVGCAVQFLVAIMLFLILSSLYSATAACPYFYRDISQRHSYGRWGTPADKSDWVLVAFLFMLFLGFVVLARSIPQRRRY
ncbi:hypothetical protein F4677DRAFT_451341 [Hypoxylon crocopeplum]|nr:hypothetical protein F4677DRAFT_451341 [Hypoxylon crocopeplum]